MTRITVAYDPTRTEWGSIVKDENKEVHFGPAELADKVRQGDLLDVERKLQPENPKYPGKNAWKIIKWKIAGTPTVQQHDQRELPISNGSATPRPPSYRPQTHPVDQKQMWVNGLGQQWMSAYAQQLSISTDGTMKKVDPDVVEQAMRAIMTVGDRMFGPTMTTERKSAPPEVDDMNDDLVPF